MVKDCKVLQLLHIEVTSKCLLRCPQCYNYDSGKDMNFSVLFQTIEEAADMDVKIIAISGGEPLLYPKIFDAIELIKSKGMGIVMATSGVGLTFEIVNQLMDKGLDVLQLSLNGSTKKIHDISRSNYDDAINALKLLESIGDLIYEVNWVARRDNVDDFENLVRMCTRHKAGAVNVLVLKPDVNDRIDNCLQGDQFFKLANQIDYLTKVGFNIDVEGCFPQLRNYLSWNNEEKDWVGCTAGSCLMAVDVDGKKIPCRHLCHLPVSTGDLNNYWNNSELLKSIRNKCEDVGEPCASCNKFISRKCVPCRAIADKIYGSLESGDLDCPIFNDVCN